MFVALLAIAVVLALLLGGLRHGAMRALVAGAAVLVLAGAALIMLRVSNLPGHGPRRWRSPS